MSDLGRVLVVLGLLIAGIGLALTLAGRVGWIGRLPGDLYIRHGHWTFAFPLATCVLLSLVLTLLAWLFGRR